MIDKSTSFDSFSQILLKLGQRAKQLRILRNLTQQELADRSGVGSATLHRFEKSGHVSIDNALRIATALNAEAGFARLFELPAFTTLDEALAQPEVRKRVRRSRSSS